MCLWLFNVKKGLLTCIDIYILLPVLHLECWSDLRWPFSSSFKEDCCVEVFLFATLAHRIVLTSCGAWIWRAKAATWLCGLVTTPHPSLSRTLLESDTLSGWLLCFLLFCFFHPSLINSPWCDLCIWLAIKCQLLQNCWWKTSLMKDQPDEKPPWWHITLI